MLQPLRELLLLLRQKLLLVLPGLEAGRLQRVLLRQVLLLLHAVRLCDVDRCAARPWARRRGRWPAPRGRTCSNTSGSSSSPGARCCHSRQHCRRLALPRSWAAATWSGARTAGTPASSPGVEDSTLGSSPCRLGAGGVPLSAGLLGRVQLQHPVACARPVALCCQAV